MKPSLLKELLELAEHQKLNAAAPWRFVEAMGLKDSSIQYSNAAWFLFLKLRRAVSHQEILDFMNARKKQERESETPQDKLPVGCVKSHFLDSGSFTLWTRALAYQQKHGGDRWGFYETKKFWRYVDDYAAFVKRYHYGIDLYANVDVIPNPVLSWRNLKYLEDEHGLKPVPVVHYTTDLKWLRKHLDEGYEIIALGGLVGSTAQDACRGWIDRCFEMVCDNPQRIPSVKIHGFGVTSYDLMLRYPWYSLDSTSWTKKGAYGLIIVPHKRRGAFVFDEQPYTISVSMESMSRESAITRLWSMPKAEQRVVEEWLRVVGVPMGKCDKQGNIIERGVMTCHTARRVANLMFYEKMRLSLPEWPWPFKGARRRQGFGFL